MGPHTLSRCVRALARLTSLHLYFNRLTSLAGPGTLPQLRHVSLRENGLMTPAMVRELSAVASLRQLWLGNCGMTEVPLAFARLLGLEEIYLFENPLAEIPEWLAALPNLKRLGLVDATNSRTKARLRKRHPHLEIW